MRLLPVVLAALTVTACGPSPSEQADLCALFALPGVPGDSQLGDAIDLAWAAGREQALFASGIVYAPPWRMTGDTRSWGRCAKRARPIEMLLISSDRAYAMTKGGRRADGKPKTFGDCFYEKRETGWRLRACRLKAGL